MRRLDPVFAWIVLALGIIHICVAPLVYPVCFYGHGLHRGVLCYGLPADNERLRTLFWTGCASLLVRIINTGNQKLWLWFGVLSGIDG